MHELLKKLNESRRKSRNLNIVLAVLAVLVVGGVLWKLTLPGIAKSADRVYCGKEEHTHTEECEARSNLICGMEETEGHTHSEDCYTERTELICELPEDENHTHEDGCYETSYELVCGQEETEGHVHDDGCYEVVDACSLEEHVHALECYSDITADLEDEGTWENTFRNVELSDNWGKNAAAIAATQLGYQESSINYEVAEDGTTMKGYTRYGAWANAKYIDWDSAFASFVLYYAQVPDDIFPTMPDNMDTANWMSRLSEWNLLGGTDTQPQAGDLVFFERTENSGIRTRVGIVSATEENEAEGITYIHVIEGDYRTGDVDVVKENRYASTDSSILGYGLLSEAEKNYKGLTDDEVGEAEAAETTEAASGAEPSEVAEATETPAEAEPEPTEEPKAAEEQKVGPVRRIMRALTRGNDSEVAAVNSARSSSNLPVTGISGSGTKYDAATGNYTTNLRVDFEFNKTDIQINSDYYFDYPEEVLVPDSLIDKQKDLYDTSGKKAGTYTFVRDENGKTSVKVNFDDSYVNQAGEKITGYVSFEGTLEKEADENGNIEINFGDNLNIKIPSSEITYPSDETDKYDIDVQKWGSYVMDGNKLNYIVYIRSRKGTPDSIQFTDQFTENGGINFGTPTVKVEQGTYQYWNPNHLPDNNDFKEITVNPTCSNGTISMTLPKLQPGTEKTQNGNQKYIEGNCYKITYTYDLADQNIKEASLKNKVAIESKDDKTNKIVQDEHEFPVSINNKHTMTKGGNYNSNTGKIDWTIIINDNHVNIAGAKLTDTMLGKLSQASDIKFEPNNGYKLEWDNGKISGITFEPETGKTTNNNRYTITYSTDVGDAGSGWNGQQVKNEANFDPTPGTPGDEIEGESSVNIPGYGGIVKDCDGMTLSEDRKTGIITWTVTVNVPASGLANGATIKDQMATGWNGTSTDQWMTHAQITAWASNLYWRDGGSVNAYTPPGTDITFLASDGKTYTYADIVNNAGGKFDKLTYSVFEIKFPNGLKPPQEKQNQLYFTYSTTVNLEKTNIGETKYYNYVEVDGKKGEAEYIYHKGGVIKTNGSDNTEDTSFSSEDGKLTWKVKAFLDDKDTTELKITDSLPEGVKLDSITLSGGTSMDLSVDANGNITGNNDTDQVSGNYKSENGRNIVSLTLTKKNSNEFLTKNAQYIFTFNCSAEDLENLELGKTYTFKNEASATTNHGSLGSDDQTQEWTYQKPTVEKKELSKSGKWDNDNRRMDYTIEINPDGNDLVENAETLELIDRLTYNSSIHYYSDKAGDNVVESMEVSLIQNSVKLYKAVKSEDGHLVKQEQVKDWNWTITSEKNLDDEYNYPITNIITGTGIPDSTPLILEYAYSVSSTLPSKIPTNNYDNRPSLNISNTANLKGTSYSDSDDHKNDKWQDQDSSGGVSTDKSYTFYKVEAGNYSKNLSGAEFSVYKYDSENKEYGEDVVKKYTTDKEGMFRIQWKDGGYEYNTLYKVIETQAPPNYKMPDSPEEHYFYFSSETDTTHTLPDDLPESAVDLSKLDKTVYVENIHNATDIVVKKVWKDKGGNITTHNSGEIQLELYRKETSNASRGEDIGRSGTDERGAEGTSVSYKIINSDYKPTVFVEDTIIDGAVIGSTITFTVKTTSSNCNEYWQPYIGIYEGATLVEGTGKWNYATKYYTGQAIVTGNTVSFEVPENNYDFNTFSVTCISSPTPTSVPDPSPGGDSPTTDKLEKEFTLSAPDWRAEFDNLPLSGKADDGSIVYYSYYVKEKTVPNYETSYDNNGGITNGIITVINQATNEPDYALPETGGSGATPYTAAGLGIMLTAGVMYTIKSRKGGRRFFRN